MNLNQFDETCSAQTVIIHQPGLEVFMSVLHPAASLYRNVTSNSELNSNYNQLKKILHKRKIKLLSVRECLKINRIEIEKLALKSLRYVAENPEEGILSSEFDYYMSDHYKQSNLKKLDSDQLVDVILTQPTFKLRYTNINTNVEFVDISFKPLGNLIYVRDQQIITQKGVIMGKFNAYVREIENSIMRKVFDNIGVNIIGEVPNGALLEGGDFMILKPNLALLGLGMRTNIEGAIYLMENDLIGCDKLALIIDENDFSQERMHLDTFFNVLSKSHVVLLDFSTIPDSKLKPKYRKVVVYEKRGDIELREKSAETESYGQYFLKEKFDIFDEFLIKEDFKICYISLKQQLDYITNFLNIGNNTVVSVCEDLRNVLRENNINNVELEYLEFEGVKNLFGAIHCATQVSRKMKGCI